MSLWHVAIFDHWLTDENGRNYYQAMVLFPAGDWGEESGWTDLAGQDDGAIQLRSGAFCGLLRGKIDDATLTALQADARYLILVRWEADVDVPSFDNRQSVVTTNQKNTFVAYFQAEFGIDVGAIPVIANSVGRTRRQVLIDVREDMRNLS